MSAVTGRMFVEAEVPNGVSRREAAAKLMRDLDDEAAKAGQQVCGDVTILEGEPGAFMTTMRLEADVETR